MHLWQWLDMFYIRVFIFVEDDAWVHNILRVKQFLYITHQLICLVAPFAAHEWRHVAACSVFGLQTAVVLIHHQFYYCAHHAIVLCNGLWRVEALIEDKVIIAFQCVSVDHGIWVVMLYE